MPAGFVLIDIAEGRHVASKLAESWKSFFDNYRNKNAETEADLFVQVGRTVAGKPIALDEFQHGVRHVARTLGLKSDDVVFEYCCGNGLVTFEIAAMVKQVFATDFTEHLIESARRFRQRKNISYSLGNALEPIQSIVGTVRPTKYLMSYALAHFEPASLSTILQNIIDVSCGASFAFLATGIPDHSRMLNFYNTPERNARRLENEAAGDVFNDGIGRWWRKDELIEAARSHGLTACVSPEPLELTNYRMDALFRS